MDIFNRLIAWFLTLVLTGTLPTCENGSSPLKWTEDVRLPDGRVVTLNRYQEFKGWRDLGSPPTESDYWFEFKNPDSGQIVRWQSDRDLTTLALMMDGAVPLLLVRPNFGGVERRNCPNPPYLLFRFVGVWEQVPVRDIPVKRVHVNMTSWPSGRRKIIESSRYHLTAEQTGNSTYDGRPYVINFYLMKEQTFGINNCGRNPDWLIDEK